MRRPPSLKKPPPLKSGARVRVVAPASALDPGVLDAAVASLTADWDVRVQCDPALRARRHLYFSGRPDERASELRAALLDPDVDAIFAVRGGYGLTSVLPLLDPAEFASARPKIVVGCSDVTALLSWLIDQVGWTAVHGPMLSSFGRGDDPVGLARLRALLFSSERPDPLRSSLPDAHAFCLAPGVATGRAVGGSLSLLAATCGTPLQCNTEGAVLFLEDVGERPYRIDRLLEQIAQAGLLDHVAAIVLGDFVGCEEPGGAVSWRDAVGRVLRRRPMPVLAGLQFGHGVPNLALPLGVRVDVDANVGTVTFRESPFAR